ncbi:MAG: protein-L-isoaspartate(D-aspartate) O-methyltransferase [Chloroflexi bacterium]|nr:protein-L-isoaspartate(D-aspartate) O-methyltransferase [Chloroflexota bacterium]
MINFVAERARLMDHLRREITSEAVLAAMARVPREMFVPPESCEFAYDDRPLPIGHGQTISQPFIIALMTQALEVGGAERVLELGTGSGYQSAILAELAREVVTVERVPRLADRAREVLSSLGYRNITFRQAGEKLGWPESGPYEAIMVTAASPQVPPALLEQLAVGGRLVIPVGPTCDQQLLKVTRYRERTETVDLGGCRFVPLIGEGAWPEGNNE